MGRSSILRRAAALVMSICMVIGFSLPANASNISTLSIDSLTSEQKDAITMLNYLTVLAQEINDSSNSRLFLDNAYDEIKDNLNLDALDEDSFQRAKELLNTIYTYQTIDTQRERIKYIYEQNQADAIKKAIPSSQSVLNYAVSGNWMKALVSVVYMAVDSKKSYDSYLSQIEEKYMQEGWQLEDAEKKAIHDSNMDTLDYIHELCGSYDIDSSFALREKTVKSFVEKENLDNVPRRIEFLETSKDTYQAYARYWLVLAENYYQNDNYEKCLEAINKYEELDVNIFEYDHDFAKACSMAIDASRELYSGDQDQYIKNAVKYSKLIEDNIRKEVSDDWSLRYLVAQTYADLYARTKDKEYLQKAYSLASTNVNMLMDEQLKKNETYLNDIVKLETTKKDTKENKEQIKNYNKWMEEERKTELPPVYQALVVNLELLRSAAEELKIDEAEKARIDAKIHNGGAVLFLVEPLEQRYWFASSRARDFLDLKFEKGKLEIPAPYLYQGATVSVSVTEGGQTNVYKNWTLEKVSRDKKDSQNTDKFIATYTTKEMDDQAFSNDSTIKLEIIPPENEIIPSSVFYFKDTKDKRIKVFNKGFLDKDTFEMIK